MIAHGLRYVAQASPHDPRDLVRKAARALATEGPTFLNVIAPCPRGWRADGAETIELAREAVNTGYWPLFEVEDGEYKLTYRPREKQPLIPWLKKQGRFAHLFKKGGEEQLERAPGLGRLRVGEAAAQVRRARRDRLGGRGAQRLQPAAGADQVGRRGTVTARRRQTPTQGPCARLRSGYQP